MVQTTRLMRVIAVLVLSLLFVSCATYETATPIVIAKETASPWADTATPAAIATPIAPTRQSPTWSGTPTVQVGARSLARASLEALSSSVGSSPLRVDIVLDNVVDLYGAEVHLRFDPAILQVQDADSNTPGEQIAPGEEFSKGRGFVALNRFDNKRGTIDLAATLVNPAEPLQGRLVLASFAVVGVKAGDTEVRFSRVLLADRNANALRVISESLTLSAKP